MFIGSQLGSKTNEVAVNNHLWMRLHATPTEKVKAQVEEIQKAISTLPNEVQEYHLQSVLEWKETFFSAYNIESPLDSEKEKAAHSILFLIFNNIDYIMKASTKNKKEMVQWQVIKNELNEILKSILPSHLHVDDFTKESKQIHEETLLRYQFGMKILEFKKKIEAVFEQLEQHWYDSADRILNDLKIEFEGIKAILIDLHTQKQIAVEGLYKEIDLLTSSTAKIFEGQGQQLLEIQDLSKKIGTQQKLTNQLLDECEAFINGK